MAEFRIAMDVPSGARATFDRLVDWDAHSRAIPLTRLRHAGPPHAGQRIVARTGWRRLGFDDPMVVELLRRPAGDTTGDLAGLVEVRKTGRVIAGTVRWTVTPLEDGARVEWDQLLRVPWLPRLFDPLVGVVGRIAYRSGLGRLLEPAN
jgi:hypothetical protein